MTCRASDAGRIAALYQLGFPLEEIGLLLDEPGADVSEHLRRQRGAVLSRLGEMQDLVAAIDRALEKEMSGNKLTRQERQELFGEGFSDEYAEEAGQHWGETEAWKQSQSRTSRYGKADWALVKVEMDATNAAFASAMADGEPATGERAMAAAEQASVRRSTPTPTGRRALREP